MGRGDLDGRRAVRLGLLLGGLAVVAFAPALVAGYLADDFVMLHTVHVLHLPAQAFTHTDIAGTRNHPYRPLWVQMNGAINAVTSAAVAHHAVNVLLHALATLLVFALARRFVSRPVAALAGGVFALYPRHAEAVAWIAGSTDLLAAALALGAVVAFSARRAAPWTVALAVLLGVAAPLAKETAFPVPALMLLLLVALRPADDGPARRRRLTAFAGTTLGVAGDLGVRSVVIHGLGNDVSYHFGLHRLVVVVGSYLLGAFSTAQMPLLVHPLYLAVPVGLGMAALAGAVLTWRGGDHGRLRLLAVGAGWFVVCLSVLYDNAVSLNTSNGERLLYLPSVGVALAVAAVAAPLLEARARRVVVAVAGALMLVASTTEAAEYVTSGHVRDRVVADIARLSPPGRTVVVLDFPDSYRSARLFGAGLDEALARAGRPDLRVLVCAPVVVQARQAGPFAVQALSGGRYLATSTPQLPFTTPESGGAVTSTACTYQPAAAGRLARGLGTQVTFELSPLADGAVYLWFDGRDMRSCIPPVCGRLGPG